MTENKRFTVKQRQGATIYSIIDYYGELPLNEGMYYKSNAEKLCKWLNTQHELLNAFCKENEQLKAICKDHRDHAIDFKSDCVRLEKENEELHQFKDKVFELLHKKLEEYPYLTLTEKWDNNCKYKHSCRENHEKNVAYASTHTLLNEIIKELQRND